MQADYKLSEQREENGIFYQKVRFYEGAVTTEDENDTTNPGGGMIPVTRYRRTGLIDEVEYTYE